MKRIAIIGNGGGGKTTLARALSKKFDLPLTHVDSIQFLPGMNFRDSAETSEILKRLAAEERWLIDGFGSMDVMQERFQLANKVIFVDFPLWRHYWWCTKRQVKSIRTPRAELPKGCHEGTLSYTITLYKILWRVHTRIRPKLVEFFGSEEMRGKVVRVGSMEQWGKTLRGEL